MDALDGNAIAGALFEHFGGEMTTASGTCGHCHNTSLLGELRVYLRAPGAVARCPICGNVVMVIVEIRGDSRFDMRYIRLIGHEEAGG
jgi:uncharacterized protein DUF6510